MCREWEGQMTHDSRGETPQLVFVFGDRLQSLREERQLTRLEVCQRAGLAWPEWKEILIQLEESKALIPIREAVKLAKGLRVHTTDFAALMESYASADGTSYDTEDADVHAVRIDLVEVAITGAKVRALREHLMISQEELRQRANFVRIEDIRTIEESDAYELFINAATRIARALEVELEAILTSDLTGDNEPTQEVKGNIGR